MSENIDLSTPVAPITATKVINSIRELILPLKRPDSEKFEDYKLRRNTANALISFYLRNHYWPKES